MEHNVPYEYNGTSDVYFIIKNATNLHIAFDNVATYPRLSFDNNRNEFFAKFVN